MMNEFGIKGKSNRKGKFRGGSWIRERKKADVKEE